jgi:lysophospholipase L1-like esterase
LANNYNAFLAGMNQAGVISATELAQRTIKYVSGQNPVLISDETLTNLTPYMQGAYAGLLPYAQARQTTSSDLVTLSAGSVIGTAKDGNAQTVYGVSYPLGDKYVLIPSETTAILTSTADFNAIIKSVAGIYSDRIAVADINASFTSFVTNQIIASDGVFITPTFTPPTGAFSEDGVHPNSRGYAYMANIFIDAINAKFGATVPKASLADYKGVGLPLFP